VPDSSGADFSEHYPQAEPPARQPVFNIPPLVLALVGLLLAIHLVINLAGENWQIWTLYMFSFIPQRLGGDPFPVPPGSQVWSFLTYAFLHADWTHVLTNCLWLVIFGTPISQRLGTARTLALLALSAIAGAAAMLPLHWGENFTLVGASGAVAGAMGAATPLMYAPGFSRTGRAVMDVVPLSPQQLLRSRNAISFTLVFLGLQVWTGASQAMLGTAYLSESVIAWEAHVGGFIAGLLAFYLLERKRPSQPPAL
jgi:membrane associated rhomboid family serine protease